MNESEMFFYTMFVNLTSVIPVIIAALCNYILCHQSYLLVVQCMCTIDL